MLDQNTDRMWYVIGAVIIGAAIIFIMNNTFPQLFASIGETFDSKSEETTETIELRGKNLIDDGGKEVDGSLPGRAWLPEFIQYTDVAPIFDKYGVDETYSLSFDVKSADTSKHDQIRVYMQNGSTSKYTINDQTFTVTKDYQRISVVIHPALYRESETDSMLAFYGVYGTGNAPIVRNVKLKLGDTSTPWIEIYDQ